MKKLQKGGPSVDGYKSNSPDRFNDYNIINSSYITMYGVPHPVLGIDNLGNKQMMVPGKDYKFPGKSVIEFPMKKYKKGGSKVDRMSSLSDEEAMYYYLNNIPLPTEPVKTMPQLSPTSHPFVGGMPSFIPQSIPNPTPKKKKEISFEPLYDKKGNITAYSPVFSGYTRHDAIKDARQVLPSHIGDVPVEFSKETYGDLWNNFMPGTTSDQWFKNGGWIPKDLKKGRCTPAPNPDCPVGSPQYNLAMTFKKHHGFHQMGGGVDNTGHAPISVPVNSRYPYGDPRAYGLPASSIMEQYNPKTREGQVVNPAFNKWADNVFWPSMDALGLAELPIGALKSLPKRVAKSMVGVDDLGMYTKVGDKQLYELGNGFGEQRALNEVKKAHQLQKKPVVPKSLKNLPEETDYNYVHTEGQRLYPNQRYSIDPRDYPEPGGMTEAKKDAYDVVGKWLMENRMGKSDRIGSLLQSIQYNQMGGQASGSYTQYSLPYGNWNTQKQWDFGTKPDPNKNKRGNQDTWKNDFDNSSAIDPEQDKKDALNAWAQKEYNARMNVAGVMGTVGSSIQGMIDGADLASQFMNKIQNQRSLDKQTHFMGYSDNQFYTGAGTSRGDYFNGMFRPDQMGNFSFAGMNNGIYYPKRAKLGLQIGEDIPNFAVPTFTSGMMPVMKSDSIPTPNTKVSVSKEAQKAYDYYLGKGLKPHIASGIVGNLVQESDMNPSITNSMGAFGVGQWLGERKTNFFNWARQNNMDPYKLETQLQYVLVEPKESKKVLAAMEKTKSPSEAAYVFANVYERMGKIEANYPRRLGVAEKLYNKTFQVGGEVEMTEEEILQFKAMGGEIEIID